MASLHPHAESHLTQGITSGPPLPPNPPESSSSSRSDSVHTRLHPHLNISFQHQQLQQQQQHFERQQQQQQQMEYQRTQNAHPRVPSAAAAFPNATPTLQQRRASIHTLNLLTAGPAAKTIGSAVGGGHPSHTRAHTQPLFQPQMRVQTPLSPQEWKGLVASGALPVRQALHTFIATSCEKPPETKEEARAVLEEMFQIRAGKIRRSIEEGKLATAEALQHKVIQRRESVVEGTLRNSRRENAPSRAMSAPSESEGAPQTTFQTNDSNMQTQSWLQSQMTDEPRMMVDEPMELPDGLQDSIMGMTSMDSNLFGDQASTFGLSDHDIMSSFTSFTAKLGDTLLARNDPAFGGVSEQDGSRMRLQFMGANGTTSVPSLSPTSMERSPTIASESLSPSPWMPWVSSDQSLMAETQKQQQAFGLQAGSQVSAEPQHVVLPMQSQSMYAGVHQTFLASTDSQMGEPQPMYTQGISTEAGKLPLQQQQMETWNQYMQYLLYQQEQGPLQQQYPHQFPQQAQVTQQTYQQSMDPHWQATMMTMMMDQNPTMERGVSPNAMSMPSGGSYQGAQPGP